MTRFLAAVSGLVLGIFTRPAGAQNMESSQLAAPKAAPAASFASRHTVNPAPQLEAEPPTKRQWYGWQTLASDAASIGLFIASIEVSGEDGLFDNTTRGAANALSALSVAGYLAGAPTIHVLHHRPLRGLASFGLRAGLPILGGAIGYNTAVCPPPKGDYGNCGIIELISGFTIGLLSAVILDASVLAWDKPKADTEPRTLGPTVGFAPVISNDGKRGELRVYGTF